MFEFLMGNSKPKVSKVQKLYQQYFGCHGTQDESSLVDLSADLEIDPDGILLLALAWKLQAKNFGEFTQEEWEKGLTEVFKVDTISGLKTELQKLEIELAIPETYREFYRFVFKYAAGEGKIIAKESALALWKSVLGDRCPFFSFWDQFLTENQKITGINLDIWMMFLTFSLSTEGDFSKYDPNSDWPSLIDKFVSSMTV